MSRRPIREKEILDPSRILNNLLRDYVDGRLGSSRVLYRAVAVKIDHIGSQFLDQESPNPKNSIQARVISDGLDMHTSDEDLIVFWPFFPHDTMPVKEGEHIYVIFEDERRSHGLWISRISEPDGIDNLNYVDGIDKYREAYQNDPRVSAMGLQKAVQDIASGEETPIVLSPNFARDATVPRFNARVGDRVIEGSHGTVIVLGRDGPNAPPQLQAGSIDIAVGFSGSTNFNTDNSSRIYVSMKTDADTNLAASSDYSAVQPGDPVNASAAIILKSDEIRIVAKRGMKIVVEGGDVHLEAANIYLGKDAESPLVLGDKFNALWGELMDALLTHVHPSAIPNGPSAGLAAITAKRDLSVVTAGPALSETVKVKP